jgi:hypothetical protein
MSALARHVGFDILYFNSHKAIAAGKDPSFLTCFSSDKMLFYVLRKPPSESSEIG